MKYAIALLLLSSSVAHADTVQVVVDGTNYTFTCDRIHGCASTDVDVSDPQGAQEIGNRAAVGFAPMEYDACGADAWCAAARENTIARQAQAALALANAKMHAKKHRTVK